MNPILQKDMEDIFSRNNSWERLENSTVVLTGAYGMLASYIVHFLLYVRTVKNINVKLIAVVRNKEKFVQRLYHSCCITGKSAVLQRVSGGCTEAEYNW